MILVADSGSTKTFWALLQDGIQEQVIQTQGMNPYFTSPEMMREIIQDELILHLTGDEVTHIYFYGAGCSTETNNGLITHQLRRVFQHAQIEVFHDILGAARALFGKEQGIACILGTGCNSCFYDGFGVFSNVPSLGYLFGDEGAGSYLGKKLLGQYLKEELPEQLKEAFDNRYPYSLEDILNAIYNKPFPNRFLASFSLFLKDHIAHPYIHQLIFTSFVEFIDAHISRYESFTSYPIGFIGSIAFYFQDILLEACACKSLTVSKILQAPVEGLVEYHTVIYD
ncbi:MAG: ATPase [Bacteroidales bacterium]|nr:ATPase [Bacteroidales bacterium]